MATTMHDLAATAAPAGAGPARRSRGDALTLHDVAHALLLVVGAAAMVALLVAAFFALSAVALSVAHEGVASLVPAPELSASASRAESLAAALRLLLVACGSVVALGVLGIAHALLRPAPASRAVTGRRCAADRRVHH